MTMTEYYDSLETRSRARRTAATLAAVRKQLAHARTHAPAYAQTLAAVEPDALQSLAQLQAIPITRKADLIAQQQTQPPFGGLVATRAALRYVHVSPGPIYEACTARADFWRLARAIFAAGFRAGDLVHNSFSYHLTPAGAMLDSGCHAIGCGVIPAGVGQSELQVQTIAHLKPTGYVGTPSFLKIIIEKAEELRLAIDSIDKALVSGEALPPPLRQLFAARGIATVQCYATADLGLIAYESLTDDGLIIDEGVYVEIVRPGSGEWVAAGEVGEVVVTTFNPDYPLIRFATGDLSAFMPGTSACGRSNSRIRGWLGRADQTAKVRGLFIHPQQIQAIVARHPEIQKARLIITWANQQDQMTLRCATEDIPIHPPAHLATAIATTIRELCKVRGEVEFVAPDALPNDGVVIDDVRSY